MISSRDTSAVAVGENKSGTHLHQDPSSILAADEMEDGLRSKGAGDTRIKRSEPERAGMMMMGKKTKRRLHRRVCYPPLPSDDLISQMHAQKHP
jgi:hypothetical protein